MTDQPQLSTPPHAASPSPQGRARGLLLTLIIVLAAGLAGAFVSQAMSEESGPGSGFGGGGWRHHGWMGGGTPDPAKIAERADHLVRHLAVEIDATTEQEDKLRGIVKNALNDLMPLLQQRQKAREQVRDLLTRPTIDRAELEKFRSEHMAMWDTASKRIIQALGDAAEALTPQQRQKVADLMAERKGFWHRWHRG